MSLRFTLDGSETLEDELARFCQTVREGVESIIPSNKLDAIVLGGGYGRGQGGVLKTESGDAPYNDLEFYVFIRGSRLWNELAHGNALRKIGDRLSSATLHVEFKVESLERLRRSPVSMFTYDLVCGHRVIWEADHKIHSTTNTQLPAPKPRGERSLNGGCPMLDVGCSAVFSDCEHHFDSRAIPIDEATRLLFNRCAGLLLTKELLGKRNLTEQENDFIGRNLAKAQLALGDVVLTALGQYHWNCLERHERLEQLTNVDGLPALFDVQRHHALGVKFKLHPEHLSKSPYEFNARHQEISGLARQIWLWLESRRLGRTFHSERDYAFDAAPKLPDLPRLRNLLVNLRTFGPSVLFDPMKFRYPRERLLKSLALLLWEETPIKDLKVMRHLQNQLHTTAADWSGLVARYKALWPRFG